MDKITKTNEELKIFESNINIHDLPSSFHYMSKKFIRDELVNNIGVPSFDDLVLRYIELIKNQKAETDIKILSLGSGNCHLEVNLALRCNFQGKIYCYELNQQMLERGRQFAGEKGLSNFEFVNADVNEINIQQYFDIIIACHSLHHFVELEHIFTEVNKCMTEESYFIINDMIGRNGHMFWDNTFYICNAIWNTFPKELKYNHQLKQYFEKRIQWDCSVEGFEGIRAQDILPLLDKYFKFKDFAPFFSVMHNFVGRDFGHNFDLENNLHIALLDMIGSYDHFALIKKILKPCQLIATMVKKNVKVSDYKYMYFEDPKEIYMQDDENIWGYFDHSISVGNLEELGRLNAIIGNLKEELESSNTIIENLKEELNSLYTSRSWKITAPLRKIKRILKSLLLKDNINKS